MAQHLANPFPVGYRVQALLRQWHMAHSINMHWYTPPPHNLNTVIYNITKMPFICRNSILED